MFANNLSDKITSIFILFWGKAVFSTTCYCISLWKKDSSESKKLSDALMLTQVLSILDWDITKRHVECLTSTCKYCDMQNYKMDVIKKIVVTYLTQAWSKGMLRIFRRRLRKLWMDGSSQRFQRRLHSDSSGGISLEEDTDYAYSFWITDKKFLGAVCDSEETGLYV